MTPLATQYPKGIVNTQRITTHIFLQGATISLLQNLKPLLFALEPCS
jgi:hypothetical protein